MFKEEVEKGEAIMDKEIVESFLSLPYIDHPLFSLLWTALFLSTQPFLLLSRDLSMWNKIWSEVFDFLIKEVLVI